MTVEVSAAIVISVISLSFSVYKGLKDNKRSDTKDIEERVADSTRINMKLDAISSSTNEIKNQLSSLVQEVQAHGNRLIVVEESVKSAHHRLDALEKRFNEREDEE